MKSSSYLLAAVKNFEGLRLKAYKCPAGVLTIGYGHTGKGVTPGLVIDAKTAEALLIADIEKVEKQIAQFNLPPLSTGKYDAVVDFCFNLGAAKFRGSTLYKKITSNPYDKTIPAEFKKWKYAGGKVLEGLVKRRAWEAEQWQRK